jgi:hypothetical protein
MYHDVHWMVVIDQQGDGIGELELATGPRDYPVQRAESGAGFSTIPRTRLTS